MFLRTVSEVITKEISWDQLNLSLTVQVKGLTAEHDVQML